MSNTVSFESIGALYQCYLDASAAQKDNGVLRVHPVGTLILWGNHSALILDDAWLVNGGRHSLCYDGESLPDGRCHVQDFFEELPGW
jgi:hypothetical protein